MAATSASTVSAFRRSLKLGTHSIIRSIDVPPRPDPSESLRCVSRHRLPSPRGFQYTGYFRALLDDLERRDDESSEAQESRPDRRAGPGAGPRHVESGGVYR